MNEETRKRAMDAFGAKMPDDLAAPGGIMDWCSDAVALLDRHGVRLYQNPAHRKMFGGGDLLGSDSFAEIHP